MSTPTITVSTTDDVQSAATTRYLNKAGIDYTSIPAEVLTVSVIALDGTTDTWSGFRPDRLKQAVADLPRTGGDHQ